ncbi:hypothetical protein ABBQ32_009531 [Trebouxia sp. C0010 RCD-2024]
MQLTAGRCAWGRTFSIGQKQSQTCRRVPGKQCSQKVVSRRHRVRAVESDTDLTEEELEEKMEQFMRSQADRESGGAVASPDLLPSKVIGDDQVSEEQAKKLCRDIMKAVNQLQDKRDMSINECKLTIAIEDPRSRERREALGIEENAGGVSRDEMAAVLMEVVDGRLPKDRIALRELYNEIIGWPWLEAEDDQTEGIGEATADYEGITPTGVAQASSQSAGWRSDQPRPPVGRDKNEKPQGLTDMLPDWMGYGFLYGVSALPVIIGILVVAVLFFNSLK